MEVHKRVASGLIIVKILKDFMKIQLYPMQLDTRVRPIPLGRGRRYGSCVAFGDPARQGQWASSQEAYFSRKTMAFGKSVCISSIL